MNLDILVKCISMVCEVFKAYLAYLNFKNGNNRPKLPTKGGYFK